MALSTYYNWDTPQTPNTRINTTTNFHEPSLPYSSDETFSLPNNFFEPYFDPTFLLYPEIYPPNILSSTSSSYDPVMSLSDIFPTTEDNCNYNYNYNSNLLPPCPKRQKYHHEEQELQHSSLSPSNLFDGFAVPEMPELFSAVPEYFTVPELPPSVGNFDFDDDVKQCEKRTEEKVISPQSVAARERRRKITERTRELGKLVPGGAKMNTAEMLNAATKYVKFLQAQVGMLQLMRILKEDEAAPPTEDLHTLVVSPFIQEKLYSEEMCFVPKEFVTTLTYHNDVQLRPTILKDLKQLVETNIEKKAKQD